MSLVVLVVLAGLLLGRLGGGSLDRLGGVPLRRRRLVVGALAAQLLGTVVGGPLYAVGLAASALLVGAFLAVNRGIRGTGLVALGLLANALVVGLNGAMPVSAEAAGRAGVSTQDLLTGADPRHELMDERTRARLLGDVVPVPLPLRPEVVSPGDVLVAAGLAQLVVLGMLARRNDEGRPRRALPPLPEAAARPARAPSASRRPVRPLPPAPPRPSGGPR